MCNGASSLIDHEHHRQSCIQQFALTLRGRLLYGVKNFLKRNDCDHCCHHILIVSATEDWFSNSERHFLSRTNDLRPADHEPTAVHMRKNLAHPRVDLFELDHFRLKSAME